MKKLKIFATTLVGLLTFTYLLGSFAQADFNITNWDIADRGIVGFGGGLMSLLIAFPFSNSHKD